MPDLSERAWVVWGAGILAVFGVLLLVFAAPLASSLAGVASAPLSLTPPPAKPSPTWAPMPTRRARTRPSSAPPKALANLRMALIQQDFTRAISIWEQTPAIAAEYEAPWYRTGARLFFALDQTSKAESLVWDAITLSPEDSESWFLLHLILRRTEEWRAAEQALDMALSLAPTRADALFWDRWMTAVGNQDIEEMLVLSESYRLQHPEAPMAAYVETEVLLAQGQARNAVTRLVEILREHPDASALVWHQLGRAYLAQGAYEEARVALEVAAGRFSAGEETAVYVEAAFLNRLNLSLAKAYLGSSECANAEAVFRRLQESEHSIDLSPWIERSVRCQTPTPTLTPWIPPQTPWIGDR